jgi:hypothetical protein
MSFALAVALADVVRGRWRLHPAIGNAVIRPAG